MTISMVHSELKGVRGALFVADSTYIICCMCIRPGPDQGCRGELTALILFVAFVFDQGRSRGAEGS